MSLARFTDHQQRVLRRLCAGQSLAEVAAGLGIKPTSVRSLRSVLLTRTPPGTTVPELCRQLADHDDAERARRGA